MLITHIWLFLIKFLHLALDLIILKMVIAFVLITKINNMCKLMVSNAHNTEIQLLLLWNYILHGI